MPRTVASRTMGAARALAALVPSTVPTLAPSLLRAPIPLLLGFMVTAPAVHAQGVLARVAGRVTSAEGTPLGDVQVTARNPATGATRGALTNADGRYTLLNLEAGTYEVTARRLGYASISRRDVRVSVGSTLRVDLTMQQSTTQLTAVQVAANAEPAIEMRRTSIETPVSMQQLEQLPTSSRNILQLGALAPGARSFAGDADGGSADFAGGRNRPGNNGNATGAVFDEYLVDGFSWKGRSAGSTLTGNRAEVFVSQESISEAKFVQYGYDAQYRGGNVVTVVNTRRGDNNFRGSLFLNGTNDNLFARNAFQTGPLNDQRNFQGGGWAAGPLVKNKLFFSVAYEQQASRVALNYAPISTNPDFAQFRTTRSFDQGFWYGFGRLTWQAAAAHTFDLAFHARRDPNLNPLLSGPNWTPEAAWTQDQQMNVAMLKHTWTPQASRVSNELVASWQTNQWFTQTQTDAPMRIYAGNIILGGLNSLWPLQQKDNIVRVTNNLTLLKSGWRGDHTFRLGGEVARHGLTYDWRRAMNPVLIYTGGLNSAPFLGQIGLSRENPGTPQSPNFGGAFVDAPATVVGLYVQDEWVPTPRLTINLGLRWSADLGHFNNEFTLPDAYARTLGTAGVPGQYLATGDRPNDLTNFAPRLRFSYDLERSGRTVLFGGYARSYDRPPANDIINERLFSSWLVYNVPLGAGAGTDAVALRQAALAGRGGAAPALVLNSNDLRNPYFDDFSIGVNRELTSSISASVNLVQKDFRRGFGGWNVNLPPRAGAARPVAQFQDVTLQDNLWGSRYRALLVSARKAYSSGSQFTVAYALGEATTDYVDPVGRSRSDRPRIFRDVPAAFADERHRVTVSGIYRLPFGVMISGVGSLATPTPRNALDGRDLNGDGQLADHFYNDAPNNFRPTGFENWYRNVDLRLGKRIGNAAGRSVDLQIDAFNAFNIVNNSDFITQFRSTQTGQPQANFGQPINAYLPRRVQVGTRVNF